MNVGFLFTNDTCGIVRCPHARHDGEHGYEDSACSSQAQNDRQGQHRDYRYQFHGFSKCKTGAVRLSGLGSVSKANGSPTQSELRNRSAATQEMSRGLPTVVARAVQVEGLALLFSREKGREISRKA